MTHRSSSSKPRFALPGLKALLLVAACTFTLTAGGDCTSFNPQTFLDGDTVGGRLTSPLVDIDHLDAPDLVTVDGVGDTFRIEVRAEDANGNPMPDTEARVNVEYDETMLELVIVCGGQDVNDHNSSIIQDCRPLTPAYHVFVNDGVMWFKFRALQEGETDVRFVYPGLVVAGFTGNPRPTPGPGASDEPGPVGEEYTEEVTTHVVIGGAASDEDDDGVPDFEDECPGTDEGTDVDEDGCPVDGPPPGADVVVINDINVFMLEGMQEANNVELVENLVDFTTAGSRNSGTQVIFDRGRGSNCAANNECGDVQLATMRAAIVNAGFTILDQNSSSGSITSIPAGVKTVFLWMPEVAFTTAEINVLKEFASEGGRIVFMGEHIVFYGAGGIAVENAFLDAMGAQMTNTGGAVDCLQYWLVPSSSMRDHQVTNGVTTVKYACSSVIDPGPSDFPLWFDQSGTQLLAGVAAIDTTPIVAALVPAATVSLTSSVEAGVEATSTGN